MKCKYILSVLFAIHVLNTFGSGVIKETSAGSLRYYNEMLIGSFVLANETDEFISFFVNGKIIVEVSGYQSGDPELEKKSISKVINVKFFPVRISKSNGFPESEMQYMKSPPFDIIDRETFRGCFKAALFLPSITFNGDGDVVAVECQDLVLIACEEEWEGEILK